MTQNIELTDAGTQKFNAWFARVAKPGVDIRAVSLNMLRRIEDDAATGQDMTYELGQQHTYTGRPEILSFGPADVIVTTESDE